MPRMKVFNVLEEEAFEMPPIFNTELIDREVKLGFDRGGISMKALSVHGVNNAMAMKYQPVWSLFSGDESDRAGIYKMLSELDQYHLLPNGMHSADEHYAGRDPSQGVELCAVVETMFSLENLIGVLGDPSFVDRLERITFNALPGTLSGDMRAHQYDQQPNQVACDIRPRPWTTNGPESNVFGLEPDFGCCTARRGCSRKSSG